MTPDAHNVVASVLAVGPLNALAASRSSPLGAIIAAATAALPRSPRPNLTSGMERARASPALVTRAASMWIVEIAAGRAPTPACALWSLGAAFVLALGALETFFDSWHCRFLDGTAGKRCRRCGCAFNMRTWSSGTGEPSFTAPRVMFLGRPADILFSAYRCAKRRSGNVWSPR